MRLYHLQTDDGTFVGREFVAGSDLEARHVAADQNSDTLHDHPGAVVAQWVDGAWRPIANAGPILPARPQAPPTRTPQGQRHSFTSIPLYEREPERHRLGELAECLAQVARALRQLERAQTAHRAEQAKRLELGFLQGRVPQELISLAAERDDAMEFAIIAARRALGARSYLANTRGLDMPELRQSELVWALRDLYEHWDEWRTADRSNHVESTPWLLTRSAGKRWERHANGQRPEGTMGATAAPPPGPPADSRGRIISWNSINIDWLTEDLSTLRDAISAHEVAAFQWEHPDQSAAAELLGASVFSFVLTFTSLRGVVARDGILRWERAMLLAAVEALRERGWLSDESEC